MMKTFDQWLAHQGYAPNDDHPRLTRYIAYALAYLKDEVRAEMANPPLFHYSKYAPPWAGVIPHLGDRNENYTNSLRDEVKNLRKARASAYNEGFKMASKLSATPGPIRYPEDKYSRDYDNGFATGYAEGKKRGHKAGHKVGFDTGKFEGAAQVSKSYDQGHESGYKKGFSLGTDVGRSTGLKFGQVAVESYELSRLHRVDENFKRTCVKEEAARKCALTYCENMDDAFRAISDLRDALGIDQADVWMKGKKEYQLSRGKIETAARVCAMTWLGGEEDRAAKSIMSLRSALGITDKDVRLYNGRGSTFPFVKQRHVDFESYHD